MKKYLLLGTSLFVASSAYAEFDCTKIPTCADLGFTMSATDCAGKNMLKCPFETDKVFCGGEIECKIGSILYDDLKCYAIDNVPSGKVIPIAVVFDTENRLAIGLKDAGPMYWMKPGLCGLWGTECNIEGIAEFELDASFTEYYNGKWYGSLPIGTILNATDNGKNNTKAVIDLGGDYALSDYAPGYCYYSTEGGQKEGSWFLPTAKESMKIVENGVKINEILTNVGDAFSNNFYYTSSETNEPGGLRLMGYGFDTLPYISSYVLKYTSDAPDKYVRCAIQY